MTNTASELKERYEQIAKTLDYNTTACDYNLRELEINTACEYIRNGERVLDVGCGLGYACTQYAARFDVEAQGIDYATNMIDGARELLARNQPVLKGSVQFTLASVLELPFPQAYFDVVTSSRCLMALLDWEKQKQALVEIHRVLKPGGVLVCMEGTFDGLEKLNQARAKFGLEAIDASGKERLFTLKFWEKDLLDFVRPYYVHERTRRFGMYYFLTRIVQPLLVAPEAPRYDHKLNDIAKRIATHYPDFEGMGHLVAFVFSKRR
jgi:ubiquinone/menaquinone biosynthesis C-methylase UbiE